MTLPKKQIRISVKKGGNRLRYAQRGGGTFASIETAKWRIADLVAAGVEFEVFESVTEWKKVDVRFRRCARMIMPTRQCSGTVIFEPGKDSGTCSYCGTEMKRDIST